MGLPVTNDQVNNITYGSPFQPSFLTVLNGQCSFYDINSNPVILNGSLVGTRTLGFLREELGTATTTATIATLLKNGISGKNISIAVNVPAGTSYVKVSFTAYKAVTSVSTGTIGIWNNNSVPAVSTGQGSIGSSFVNATGNGVTFFGMDKGFSQTTSVLRIYSVGGNLASAATLTVTAPYTLTAEIM